MVLSEPFGRIEARTTYGKVPPRKRPALGRRYRSEQDFSSGLRRRDDRRTGTPDQCSAALYGRVLKAATPGERVMRDCDAKGNMTNTGLEKRRPTNEEELPVGLLHGTSGQSEDWSQVVEQLTSHRPVIRPKLL
jgi:hypothetical protein